MWQQLSNESANKGDVSSKDSSGQQDSGIVDSGFLSSGGNLLTSELEIEEDEPRVSDASEIQQQASSQSFGETQRSSQHLEQDSVATESMRVDSGLDLGLSESLSQLSLKQINLNRLGRTKVQSEPTVELTPVKSCDLGRPDAVRQRSDPQAARGYSQEPWELYYMQDEDGDTLVPFFFIFSQHLFAFEKILLNNKLQ